MNMGKSIQRLDRGQSESKSALDVISSELYGGSISSVNLAAQLNNSSDIEDYFKRVHVPIA